MRIVKATIVTLLLSFSCRALAQNAAPLKGVTDRQVKNVAAPRSLELNEQGAAAAKKGDINKAEQLFKQALIADSHNLTAVYNLAGIYAVNKREREAKKLLEDYIQRQPNDPNLHARLGDINFSLAQPQAAVNEYEKALALAPKYAGIYSKLATLYVMQKRPKDAEVALRIAVKEEPKNAELYRNFSAVLLSNNKASESIAAAKRALQLETSAEAYITLGAAYEISKDYKNALIAYQRAADLDKEHPGLQERIEQIKDLLD